MGAATDAYAGIGARPAGDYAEELVEARRDFLALDTSTVEQPSGPQGIHKVRFRIATSYVLILGGIHAMHRGKSESDGAGPREIPEAIPLNFRLLKRRCDKIMAAVDERHAMTISCVNH